MVTDIIGGFIIRIKNANLANKESLSVYTSKNKIAVADALARAGYIKSFSKNSAGKMLDIVLNYKSDKTPKILGVQRVSKPSRRVYQKSGDIKPFKNGFGTTIISTPAGILTNKEAVKQKVGGEVLFKIW
ncbi:MAG: 30S ribosomal protein S8 [Candidatus Paceibacterota bacterium]|jgi:small subunit ribosomal protein S8